MQPWLTRILATVSGVLGPEESASPGVLEKQTCRSPQLNESESTFEQYRYVICVRVTVATYQLSREMGLLSPVTIGKEVKMGQQIDSSEESDITTSVQGGSADSLP